MSESQSGDWPMSDTRFWTQPGIYVERLPDDALSIEVGPRKITLNADSAESLLQWMDRSRA